jgi:hypothetical protein
MNIEGIPFFGCFAEGVKLYESLTLDVCRAMNNTTGHS